MIKVASYCRVSTDKTDQVNSFESQQRYFSEYIMQRPDWELFQIYADEGITGTSTKKRTQFNQMIEDAFSGCFQLILTKEISRFSRNILDTIQYTRDLKQAGVGVLFMTENLDTRNPETEMLMTFMGTIAQEESRRTSVRVKWGQARQMEQGVVFGRSLLGYNVRDGKISVEPNGAEVVQHIFFKYGVEKKGTSTIARELEEAGYHTQSGNTTWNSSYIIKVLKNEKYVGDLVQKKTYTPDYLSHAKKYNHGQEELITIQNHHEPIISRSLWNTVQAELVRRRTHNHSRSGHSVQYLFSGKIRCGCCGSAFIRRKKKQNDGSVLTRWGCSQAARQGTTGCSIGKLLRDDDARYMLYSAVNSLHMDIPLIAEKVTELINKAVITEYPEQLNIKIRHLHRKKAAAMDAFFSNLISEEDFRAIKDQCDMKIFALMKELNRFQQPVQPLQNIIQSLLTVKTECDVFWGTLLEEITVFSDQPMELRLKGLDQVIYFS